MDLSLTSKVKEIQDGKRRDLVVSRIAERCRRMCRPHIYIFIYTLDLMVKTDHLNLYWLNRRKTTQME